MEHGLIQVYTGTGKGKTTAATGLLVRALGQGMHVLLVRFFKPAEPLSGEVRFLEGAAGLRILTAGVGVFGATDPRELERSVRENFAAARRLLAEEHYDLVVLDEINNVLHRGLLEIEDVLRVIDERPAGTELVLTGRNAPPEVLERADLVSRIENVKHPFEQGIAARRGIEY